MFVLSTFALNEDLLLEDFGDQSIGGRGGGGGAPDACDGSTTAVFGGSKRGVDGGVDDALDGGVEGFEDADEDDEDDEDDEELKCDIWSTEKPERVNESRVTRKDKT